MKLFNNVAMLQIYEWCQYQKKFEITSNKDVSSDLYLSSALEVNVQPPHASKDQLVETTKPVSTMEVDEVNLLKMKAVYQKEDEDYKALHQLCNHEKKKAQQMRELRSFPPFERWVPKGRPPAGREVELLAGPNSTATSLREYTHEESGRRPHTFKSESVVCQLGLPTLMFGCVKKILVHKFAGCEYVWLFIGWFPPPKYDPESRILYSANKVEQTSPILISKASRPLVIAQEGEFIWFLDAPISGNQ